MRFSWSVALAFLVPLIGAAPQQLGQSAVNPSVMFNGGKADPTTLVGLKVRVTDPQTPGVFGNCVLKQIGGRQQPCDPKTYQIYWQSRDAEDGGQKLAFQIFHTLSLAGWKPNQSVDPVQVYQMNFTASCTGKAKCTQDSAVKAGYTPAPHGWKGDRAVNTNEDPESLFLIDNSVL